MRLCFITFLSQTQALQLKRMAKGAGIGMEIVQTPKAISYGGCSYAVRCRCTELPVLLSLCRKHGVNYSRVFRELTDERGRKFYEETQR